jgi:hypothetical protein
VLQTNNLVKEVYILAIMSRWFVFKIMAFYAVGLDEFIKFTESGISANDNSSVW